MPDTDFLFLEKVEREYIQYVRQKIDALYAFAPEEMQKNLVSDFLGKSDYDVFLEKVSLFRIVKLLESHKAAHDRAKE